MAKISYDDGIDRAIVLTEIWRPHLREEGHSDKYIQALFNNLIEVLKAEKTDAID